MSEQTSSYIEELYNSSMWLGEKHKRKLYEKRAERGLTDDQLKDLVDANSQPVKKAFAKVFNGIGNKENYYSVPCRIFKTGELSDIVIACKYKFQRLVGHYRVYVVPYYCYEKPVFDPYTPNVTDLEAENNALHIPFTFDHEDLYKVNVFYILDDQEMLLLTTYVYALEEDLYNLNYYKADFHMHTTFSDGYEEPELAAVSARGQGLDIIAVTDHNAFSGSVETRKRVKEMGLDMTVILGEECSVEYSPMHILALGLENEVDGLYLSKKVLNMPMAQEIISQKGETAAGTEALACIQVLLDYISRNGGISILAHPLWKPVSPTGVRKDTTENLFVELGKDRRFDGIEVVSGSPNGQHDVTSLQASLVREILGSFEGFPVIGITDSHRYTTDHIAGKHYTIVFARSKENDDVLEALRAGRTVAVEVSDGTALCYGTHRYMKFGYFLIQSYFPARDLEARLEAERIKKEFLLL